MNIYKKMAHELWLAPDDEEEWAALLRSHIEPLVAELQESEWKKDCFPYHTPDHAPYCPQCGSPKKDGHAPNCQRQTTLAQWTE